MKLVERFENVAARRRLARRTRECYWGWIVEFLRFHRSDCAWRPPAELNEKHVEAFLNHLVLRKRVSASTQNQAICALVFLYKQVIVDEVGEKHLGRFEAERAIDVGFALSDRSTVWSVRADPTFNLLRTLEYLCVPSVGT